VTPIQALANIPQQPPQMITKQYLSPTRMKTTWAIGSECLDQVLWNWSVNYAQCKPNRVS
jgi:hypothetical protein